MTLPADKLTYTNLFPGLSIDGVSVLDIWRAWQISSELKDTIQTGGDYVISENDRWDTISEELYGKRDYWWLLALFNEVEDPFEIYFDQTITTIKRSIKIIKESDIPILINEIRRKRLQFETGERKEETTDTSGNA